MNILSMFMTLTEPGE